jgi:lipoprotein-anchoring transpeptidase ErfK/SrfK
MELVSHSVSDRLLRRTVCSIALAAVVILVALPTYAQRSRSARHIRQRREVNSRRKAGLEASKINNPDTRDSVGPHSEGEAVVRAAILLSRLKFSPGEITSNYNDNLAKAIAAFQSVSGLSEMGAVDAATWTALNADQASGYRERAEQNSATPRQDGRLKAEIPQNPAREQSVQAPTTTADIPGSPPLAVVSYIITLQDVSGPFTRIPKVSGRYAGQRQILREAKLPRLNFESPLDLLAEKFHSSARLLVQLNPGRQFDKAGEKIQVPNVLTSPPPQAGLVVVDASTHSVTALDVSARVLAFYPATVGSEHDPLPVGNWKVAGVKWYPEFKYNPNLFWDSEDKHPRVIIRAGPRNPVGVVWIGLSKEHYGIHGTSAPSEVGKKQSHGCIRLTNWDASELANMVHPGTPVLLKEGAPAVLEERIHRD